MNLTTSFTDRATISKCATESEAMAAAVRIGLTAADGRRIWRDTRTSARELKTLDVPEPVSVLAHRFGISRSAIYQAINDGSLPHVRFTVPGSVRSCKRVKENELRKAFRISDGACAK